MHDILNVESEIRRQAQRTEHESRIALLALIDQIEPLENLVQKYQPLTTKEDRNFMKEFILWSLVEFDKLSKKRFTEGYQFNDLYSD